MKRQAVVVLGLILLAGMVPAFAKSSAEASFDVPFEFVAGNVTLPAGQYTVSYNAVTSALTVREAKSGACIIVLSNPAQNLQAGSETKLVFHRYGAKTFLRQLWMSGYNIGREVPKSGYEREIMAKLGARGAIQVAAK